MINIITFLFKPNIIIVEPFRRINMSINIKLFLLFFYSYFQERINSGILNISTEADDIISINVDDISYDILCNNNLEVNRAKTLIGEEDVLRFLREKFDNGSVFYDIGANIGTHSLYMSKLNRDNIIISFEPERENFAHFVRNISYNEAHNIDAHNIGLGSSISFGNLFLFSGLPGDGGNTLVPVDNAKTQNIILSDLDTYMNLKQLPYPDFVKIDVEGYELQVLLGMKNILSTIKPSLLIELHPKYLESQFGNAKIVHHFLDLIDYSVIEIPLLTRGSQIFIYANPKNKILH